MLSDEFPCARFFKNIFQVFSHHFVLAKLASSSIRVNIELDFEECVTESYCCSC